MPSLILNPGALEQRPDVEPARPGPLQNFLRRIALHKREFVIYDDGWRGWTYRYPEVARMAGALSARFRTNDFRKGDCILIWSESRPGWLAALWACIAKGVVLVPIEPQASLSLLRRIELQVKPRAILLGDQVAGIEASNSLPVWLLRDIETEAAPTPFYPVSIGDDDVAEIIYTSGTTAEPKGVVMTQRNLSACLKPLEDELAPYRKYLRLLKPLRVLNLLPMSHLFGQVVALFVVPLIPASVVFMDSTSPEEIARQIHKRRICALVSVPKVLEVLRNYVLHRFPETSEAATLSGPWAKLWWRYRAVHQLFGWRFCCFVVGGAALPAEVEQFWSGLGFVVAQGYGLTETAPIISFNHPFHSTKGTAGKPIAGLQIRLAQDGEVLVRGDSVTPGYFQLPSETAAAFEDGWFHTGDIGEFTAEGNLVIRGRKKDLIVTPEGLKIFPDDVEGVLNKIDGVKESAVLDKNGVYAVIVLRPGFRGEDTVRQANQQLEPHQRIRSFSIWEQAELPRTSSTHKIRRAEIAATLLAGKPALTKSQLSVTDVVQKYAPGRTISPDTSLDELGLSSLDRVELILDLEEKLDISIDDSALSSVKKVSDLTVPTEIPEPIPEPTYNRTWLARFIRRVLLPTVFLPLTRLFAKLTISGTENIDELDGPVIFAANHQSYIDPAIILASLEPRWRYRIAPAMWMEYFDPHFHPERHSMFKRLRNTLLYRLVTLLFNAFPLSQAETGTRQTLRYIGELTEDRWSILIFPEGERSRMGEIGRFYPGVAMIASRMRVPVVPIRLVGVDKVLDRNSGRLRPGAVEVRIGKAIDLHGSQYETLAKQLEDVVRAL
ncbi:MAG: AMP-binding protein [Terriglobia bacterium]|nr:AMP-binding protein [Terriglobia bacterium]